MPTTNLGRVSYIPKGAYSASAAYKRQDCVTFNGNTYAALKDTTGHSPDNTEYWQILVDNSAAAKAVTDASAAQQKATQAANSIPTTIQTEIAKLTDENADMAEVISARTTADDFTYPSLKARQDAQYLALREDIRRIDYKTGTHMYGILWDKTNATCTRLYDAEGMTAAAYKGTYSADLKNDFDNVYPWSHRKLCNVDLVEYKRLHEAGGDIEEAITAWEGDPDFSYTGENGAVMVYTPAFWMHAEETDGGVIVAVADGELEGWIKVPRYIGGRYFASDDGDSGITSVAGVLPLVESVSIAVLHSRAKAKGMTIEDIWTYSADTVLMAVEFATLNSQAALGDGVASLYRASNEHPFVAENGATRVIVPSAFADVLVPGAILAIGATNDKGDVARRIVTSVENYPDNGSYRIVNFSGATVNITTAQFINIHGLMNTADEQVGSASGYIGTNGKSNAYYRGRVAHANMFRYILGAYRQANTEHIWIAHDREEADQYDALDVSKHIDTGFVLPRNKDEAAGAYINALHFSPEFPLLFPSAVGGNSSNPVGDYTYWPVNTAGNTILRVGGGAGSGAYAGRFYSGWNGTSSSASWYSAALPFLK